MLTRAQVLEPLAKHRTDEVIVTTMGVTRPWGRISDSDLDFASADSAMGHAADLALGIALARPDRTVACLNGDGSMLMTLGTLATVVGSGASNYVLFVIDNGVFEITGHQSVAASGQVDYAAMAQAAGFQRVLTFDDARSYAESIGDILTQPGPTFVHLMVEPGSEGPISRNDREKGRYLRTSLAEWSRTLKAALETKN
ncbi:MAG: thiamine pyrophosphate-dependent enzyme [Gemmatimonadetes bacterium]|nr:thiamine pyrophosphate-dependent enzyme [Gemmatimonadota bacterium]HIC14807.1 thiamine pyrophosphate-binding protein [Gemmatimonadota bacterium]